MKHILTGYFFFIVVLCIVTFWYGFGHTFHFPPTSTNFEKKVMGTTSVENGQGIQTTITHVIDGDTFQTSEGQKVRYIGINAPELGQPYGKEAAKFNKTLVEGKRVRIVLDKTEKDAYSRILGYVYVGDVLVNKEIIAKGWAIADAISPNTKYAQEFAQAEKVAHKNCQGIWADTCMPKVASCITISTIHFDAKEVDTQNLNDEWVQITNKCTAILNLKGWLLKDSSAQNNYTFGNITIPPGVSMTIHSGCGIDTTVDLYWECPAKDHAIWNNTGDEALLFDNYGKLLSDYSY